MILDLATWNEDPLSVVFLIATASSLWPVRKAWIANKTLPLRAALAWAILAAIFAILGELQSLFEPVQSGRPLAGHWIYLATLATLATMVSVFNARTPGGGAWAILMALLVLVFLLPWLEGFGLARGRGNLDRLRLEMPWSLFFAVIAIAAVTNYLPTHHGPAAAILGLALVLELAALVLVKWPAEQRSEMWLFVPVLLSAACWMALVRARRRAVSSDSLTRLWLWFRDQWGVVWGLRTLDRFNRSAEAAKWPIRLCWQGPRALDGGEAGEIPVEATKTLLVLLRRFAPLETLDAVAKG